MFTPRRTDADDDSDGDERVGPDPIAVATGGRYYEDETWATSETPAAFLQPQTGYENAAAIRGNGGVEEEDQESYMDYTYANEGEDYSNFEQFQQQQRRRGRQEQPLEEEDKRRSTPTTEEDDYRYPDNGDVPDRFSDNGASNRNGRNLTEEEEEASYYKDHHYSTNARHNGAAAIAAAADPLPPGVTARDRAEDEAATLRLLAHELNREWGEEADREIDDQLQDGSAASGQPLTISPSLERRLRDFRFAQGKRRERYGNERPWGILGLYDHLLGVRIDVEWSEDAAWRREHREPYLSWADFEDTRNSGFNRPWFTYFILVVCTGVLIASIGVNGWQIEPMSVNPMIGPSAETLIKMGAKQTTLIVDGGQWYRLFSPMVLHAGLIHYLLNMLALWFIGSAVEQAHGYLAAAIIFVISAVGGNILSAIFLPEYISVGASGGIFGLIGACLADITINWKLLFSKEVNKSDAGTRLRNFKVLLWLIFDILINCLIGLTPFVDNFTHLGGMVYGFLCGLSAIERLPQDFFGKAHDSCSRIRNYAVRFFGLILSVVLIMISTALLVESDGGTSPCSNCRYVSCVPFPFWAPEDSKWWYCDDCDRVKGDVTKDDATGYYDVLTLTCPNGEVETIDLSGQDIEDSDWLRNQLPTFCRQNCASLFA